MLYLVWDLITSTPSLSPPRPLQLGNGLPPAHPLHLLARFMGACVEIYCSLHLESFFIVVMLTQKNILGPDVGVYHMHTWALPAD